MESSQPFQPPCQPCQPCHHWALSCRGLWLELLLLCVRVGFLVLRPNAPLYSDRQGFSNGSFTDVVARWWLLRGIHPHLVRFRNTCRHLTLARCLCPLLTRLVVSSSLLAFGGETLVDLGMGVGSRLVSIPSPLRLLWSLLPPLVMSGYSATTLRGMLEQHHCKYADCAHRKRTTTTHLQPLFMEKFTLRQAKPSEQSDTVENHFDQ